MTYNEKMIEMICLETGYSKNVIETIVTEIEKYDYACFVSQMGDYDHPEERKEARMILNEKLNAFEFTTAAKLWCLLGNGRLNPREEKIAQFYHDNFHSMKSDYEAE